MLGGGGGEVPPTMPNLEAKHRSPPTRTPNGASDRKRPAYLHPLIQEHLLAERALEKSRLHRKEEDPHHPMSSRQSRERRVKKTIRVVGNERHEITTTTYPDGRKDTTTRILPLSNEERFLQQQQDRDTRQMHPSIQEHVLADGQLERRQMEQQAPSESSAEASLALTPRRRTARAAKESEASDTPDLLHPYLQEHYMAEKEIREEEERKKEAALLARVQASERENPGAMHPTIQEHYLAMAELPAFRPSAISTGPSSLIDGYRADPRPNRALEPSASRLPPSVDKASKKKGWTLARRKKDKGENNKGSQVSRGLDRIRETEDEDTGKRKAKPKSRKSGLFGRSKKGDTPPVQQDTQRAGRASIKSAWEHESYLSPPELRDHDGELETGLPVLSNRKHPEVEGYRKLQATAAAKSIPPYTGTQHLQQQSSGMLPQRNPSTAGRPRMSPSPSMQMSGYQPLYHPGVADRTFHPLVAESPEPPPPLQMQSRAKSFSPGKGREHIITDVPESRKPAQQEGDHGDIDDGGSRSSAEDYDRPPITEHVARRSDMSEVTTPWELRSNQQNGYESDERSELSYDSMDYVEDDQWEALEKALENGGPEAARKWEEFLIRQGAMPSEERHDAVEEGMSSQEAAQESCESLAGIQTTFTCACCHDSKRTKESGHSCNNTRSPHLVCSDCIRDYLWSSKETEAPFEMIRSKTDLVCRLPCFTSFDGLSRHQCQHKIHVVLSNLFDPAELEFWKNGDQEDVHITQQKAPATPVSSQQKKAPNTPVSSKHKYKRNAPLSPKQQIQVAMKEAAKRARVRTCSMCKGSLTKKNNGCNAMKCPVCSTISCFVCRQVVSPAGYDQHFDIFGEDERKCPLLTDAATDRQREELEMKHDILALANQVLEDFKLQS
eukprot:scaffold692_cov118-Cylindrotheca_fusiformis.AAC.14